MRKVELNMKELNKYQIIKNLVDNNGNKNRAAVKLGLSVRQINRLIKVYKEQGKEGFSHKNKGKKPANNIPAEIKERIISLVKTKYYDANWTHLVELLERFDNIKLSYYALHNLLINYNIISPKCHKNTRKTIAENIQEKMNNNTRLTEEEKNLVVENNILDWEHAHPRIPRAKNAGERLEMDASCHLWFGDKKTTLHGAIDCATGRIVLYFDYQETLKGYYGVLKSVLINYGIPYRIVTDRRTVFEYNSKKDQELVKDTFTQFGYACKQLGISLETTSVPEHKPRIERLWGTLQSRLPVELRLAGITTIEKANEFIEQYTKTFNEKFAIPIDNTKSVFENQPSIEKINTTLAIISPRVFDKGSSIKYQNKYWQAYQDGTIVPFKNKTKALVIRTLDDQMIISVDDKLYELRELIKHKQASIDFDEPDEVIVKPKKVYIPPMSHPWKHASYMAYVASQKHHQNNAYV